MAEHDPNIRLSARLSVAPMMDWTDRHCRFFHRQLSRHALLYTEMVTAPAVIHGDRQRLLGFSPAEHPLALQLGGSDPEQLAEAARIGAGFGYDEINLNVGCPSDRVQSGAFGACLMQEPQTVARCCAAMIAALGPSGPEVTVKCRIGVDEQDPQIALREFVRIVSEAGVNRLTVHARKAWLKGLSPKENRSVPPLDYPLVHAIKAENLGLHISINGGITRLSEVAAHFEEGMDGAMIGRAAYHEPWEALGAADETLFGAPPRESSEAEIVAAMAEYTARMGVPVRAVARHMLGLISGRPGAKAWRRTLTERMHTPGTGTEIFAEALEAARFLPVPA